VVPQQLRGAAAFPDPRNADRKGLLAYGGDLEPKRLLGAYARGIFPWYERGPVLWFSPDPRMVLLPDELHLGRSLRRRLARSRFEVRFDTAFERVITCCAEVPRRDQVGTWITPDVVDAYLRLHEQGYAHSVESWRDGELVGGLYGVSLGAAFFGESMFSRESDASRAAFVALVRQLRAWEFELVDCQVPSEHLARLGARAWSRGRFLDALDRALEQTTRVGSWRWEASLARLAL